MYALVIIDFASQIGERAKIQNFLLALKEATENDQESSMISESIWLINLKSNLTLLRRLLDLLDGYSFPYKISYSETRPEFTT